VSGLNHVWQRFLLASSLLVGLIVGAALTVFGYSNTSTVDVRFSVLHLTGVPLWAVAVVPLAFVLVAGTLYHWLDTLHHFTEHMRHRRRVHELESELASLRAHLDQVLEMPVQSTTKLSQGAIAAEPLPAVEEPAAPAAPALPEPALDSSSDTGLRKPSRSRRATLSVTAEPAGPASATTNGGQEALPSEGASEA
jgi:hypothetical protein